jgi:hypothetical protein
LIPICYAQSDRRAQGPAIFNTRQDGNPVAFIPVGGQQALAGTTAVKLGLYIRFTDRQARRTAIDHRTDAFAVGFAESGYPENSTECA